MWPRELKPLFYGWGVHIKIDVGFRIDELLAKLGNRLLYWGRGVPFMRMTLDFDVHTGGAHRVEYNGSAIPTQMYQTDAETDMYDMVNDVGGYQDIETALSAGFEAKAPLRLKPVVKRT
jgi:hypothetical protein